MDRATSLIRVIRGQAEWWQSALRGEGDLPSLRTVLLATPKASRDAHATSGPPLGGGSTARSPLHELSARVTGRRDYRLSVGSSEYA